MRSIQSTDADRLIDPKRPVNSFFVSLTKEGRTTEFFRTGNLWAFTAEVSPLAQLVSFSVEWVHAEPLHQGTKNFVLRPRRKVCGAVVGQASRLPLGRLAPASFAGETPAKTAGTAAPLVTGPCAWSQCPASSPRLSMNRSATCGPALWDRRAAHRNFQARIPILTSTRSRPV